MTEIPDLYPELVVGMVSAVGTDNARFIRLFREVLEFAGYEMKTVKISEEVIPQVVNVPTAFDAHFDRIQTLMNKGNESRALNEDDSILAQGVSATIFSRRTKGEADVRLPHWKTVHIVDSLKRPEEVTKLREIYTSGFVLIGVHEEEPRRRAYLGSKGLTEDQIETLIKRDAQEEKVEHGQRVNRTFHLADFFVQIEESEDRLKSDVRRIVELWFGNPFLTPTFDEFAMFMAFAAALRSADLSRQVGAVVTRDSQIVSTGANDCPRFGGGLYWPLRSNPGSIIRDEPRGRDCKREDGDSNRAEQLRLIGRILEDAEKEGVDVESLEKLRAVLGRSGICDLTEFGRVVHAEMEALLSCSRTGQSTVGTTLFSTTFPCHNCAKHIVAAGVHRVVYVEPYPKSKALDFHDDSIESPGQPVQGVQSKVRFEPFVGIGPRRFFDMFSMQLGGSYPLLRKDKQTGKPIEWDIQKAQLRIQAQPNSYLELEAEAVKLFLGKTLASSQPPSGSESPI